MVSIVISAFVLDEKRVFTVKRSDEADKLYQKLNLETKSDEGDSGNKQSLSGKDRTNTIFLDLITEDTLDINPKLGNSVLESIISPDSYASRPTNIEKISSVMSGRYKISVATAPFVTKVRVLDTELFISGYVAFPATSFPGDHDITFDAGSETSSTIDDLSSLLATNTVLAPLNLTMVNLDELSNYVSSLDVQIYNALVELIRKKSASSSMPFGTDSIPHLNISSLIKMTDKSDLRKIAPENANATTKDAPPSTLSKVTHVELVGVIMPIGAGKTTIAKSDPRILDIDDVVSVQSDDLLTRLHRSAIQSGEWDVFNAEYYKKLRIKLAMMDLSKYRAIAAHSADVLKAIGVTKYQAFNVKDVNVLKEGKVGGEITPELIDSSFVTVNSLPDVVKVESRNDLKDEVTSYVDNVEKPIIIPEMSKDSKKVLNPKDNSVYKPTAVIIPDATLAQEILKSVSNMGKIQDIMGEPSMNGEPIPSSKVFVASKPDEVKKLKIGVHGILLLKSDMDDKVKNTLKKQAGNNYPLITVGSKEEAINWIKRKVLGDMTVGKVESENHSIGKSNAPAPDEEDGANSAKGRKRSQKN